MRLGLKNRAHNLQTMQCMLLALQLVLLVVGYPAPGMGRGPTCRCVGVEKSFSSLRVTYSELCRNMGSLGTCASDGQVPSLVRRTSCRTSLVSAWLSIQQLTGLFRESKIRDGLTGAEKGVLDSAPIQRLFRHRSTSDQTFWRIWIVATTWLWSASHGSAAVSRPVYFLSKATSRHGILALAYGEPALDGLPESD